MSECRVETVVPDGTLPAVIDSPRRAHPHEEPVVDVYPRLGV